MRTIERVAVATLTLLAIPTFGFLFVVTAGRIDLRDIHLASAGVLVSLALAVTGWLHGEVTRP